MRNILNKTLQSVIKMERKSQIDVIYLSYESNPLTSITIQFHIIKHTIPSTKILYREEGKEDWKETEGEYKRPPATDNPPPHTDKRRWVCFTKLEGLNSGTKYEFKVKENTEKTYNFKTMPENLVNKEIKIAIVSDCHGFSFSSDDYFQEITEMIGEKGFNADIVLGAGDYTYGEGRGRKNDGNTWFGLLKTYQQNAITSDNCLIPFLPALGNHDVNHVTSNSERKPENAKHYSSLFCFPTKNDEPIQKFGLGNLVFGSYLQILILDTGTSTYGINDNEQLDFLDNIDGTIKHIIPVYHRAMHGIRDGNVWNSEGIQEMFAKTFYDNGVNVVVEAHNHTWNYTASLGYDENEHLKLDENGFVLLGEGCWGYDGTARNVDGWENSNFILDAKGLDKDIENARHFWGITISENSIKWEAMNYKGEVIYSDTKNV